MRNREPAPELAAMESRMPQELEAELIEDQTLGADTEEDQEQSPDISEDDAQDDTPADGEQPESEGLEITIDGFEPEQDPEEAEAAKPWVNKLRKDHRAAQKRIRELESQLNQGQKQEEAVIVGQKPTLADCDFDEERLDREMDAFYSRKAKFEAQQREKLQAQEAEKRLWDSRVQRYQEEKTTLPVEHYEDAEAAVESAMSQVQLGIIVKAADKPAQLVYALGKNPKALETLAAIKDPVDFAVSLGKMMASVKTAPKKPIPSPERVVRGGSGKSPGVTGSNLDRLREEAQRTGDYTRYYEAKRKANA